ncbi:MAG: 50S ribosomal protein L7/L12 [Clostridiales bacterium]|nr:50S ribosomal protein L7/L12 [Clostridiales bacterium]MCD7802747.1 50S ribosomal protein L7/L12 [Clostridiales bacterium]MCD7881056.1 50S ribosomal protein L7/L12 [Clostridiales bacterium]MCD8384854.1 50S ribosomal protein L7/L12 [Clostridiales bacterium]
MSEKINAIVEEIKGLSLLEVKELTDALKETFGVEAVAMAGPAGGAAAAAPEVEEKTEFDVVLASFDAAAKIKVIKAVREATGLGLADAKKAVEGAPYTLKEAATKEEADALKEKIEAVGGKVELK